MAFVGLAPYRCRACRNRFYGVPAGNGNDVRPFDAQVVTGEPTTITARPVTSLSLGPELSSGPQPSPGHALASVPVAHSLLVVSRDPAIRKLLCKLLARPGFHTHQLADVAELPSELRARKVDVLIIDLDEPEEHGFEKVATLRGKYQNLKIIALSGLLVPNVPGSIVLPKPFRREVLIESVQSLLADAASTYSRDVKTRA